MPPNSKIPNKAFFGSWRYKKFLGLSKPIPVIHLHKNTYRWAYQSQQKLTFLLRDDIVLWRSHPGSRWTRKQLKAIPKLYFLLLCCNKILNIELNPLWARWPIEPVLNSGFCSVLKSGWESLCPPGRDTNPSQVSSQQTLVFVYLPWKDGKLS